MCQPVLELLPHRGISNNAIFDRMCEHGPLSFIGVAAIAVLAWWLGTDYDWRGVLMIAVHGRQKELMGYGRSRLL